MATNLRILVTGSRTWEDVETIHRALAAVISKYKEYGDGESLGNVTLVHGACPSGADRIADQWAGDSWVYVEKYPADWSSHGKRAGYIRNQLMVDKGADVCLAFLDRCMDPKHIDKPAHPSHGAAHTAEQSEKAGITTLRIYGEGLS